MDEKEWAHKIPLSVFSEEAILMDLEHVFLVTMLPGFGLQNHAEYMIDSPAIKDFLKHRFRFFEDGKELTVFAFT